MPGRAPLSGKISARALTTKEAAVAGKDKHVERMSSHLNEPIDSACPITRPGGTASQIGLGVGGVVGAAIAGAGKHRDSDVKVGQFAWLGLGAAHWVITKASMMGKPTGEPLARVAYADVTDVALTAGKVTMRADISLNDGRHIAFETQVKGQNKAHAEILEILRSRCGAG